MAAAALPPSTKTLAIVGVDAKSALRGLLREIRVDGFDLITRVHEIILAGASPKAEKREPKVKIDNTRHLERLT